MEENSLEKKLFDSGIVIVPTNLTQKTVGDIIMDLLSLKADNPKKDIHVYISSMCTDFVNVMALYDVIKSLPNPVSTYAIGKVAAMSILLLSGGNKGKRYILKHSTIEFAEVVGVINQGVNQQTEVELEANEASKQREAFEKALNENTGTSIEKIHQACLDKLILDAKQALKFGLVDEILE